MSPSDHSATREAAPTGSGHEIPDRTSGRAGRPAGRLRGLRGRTVFGSAAGPICIATAVLFLLSWIFEPSSVRHSAILGMLPFAAILAIAAMGQTLVVQQGGIDLSVPGMVSVTVVLMTQYPNGDASKLAAAVLFSFAITLGAGTLSGVLVSLVGVTPIVATLGMNALLYGAVLEISNGTPRTTTNALFNFASGKIAGIPNTVVIAIVLVAFVAFVIKLTVIGRRFEAVGAGLFAARAAGLEGRRYQFGAYVAAAALYCVAAILLAGVVSTPSVFQGDSYLLPTVAAVVLGGTSLLGGRGSVVASAVAALFITQLDQFVLVTGAKQGVQNLVDAAALAAGLAIYSVPWRRLFESFRRNRDGRARGVQESADMGGGMGGGSPMTSASP